MHNLTQTLGDICYKGKRKKGAEREGGGERKEVLLAKGWQVRDGGRRETRVIRVVGVVIE